MLIADLSKLTITQKTGSELFHENGQVLPFDVLSFWRWSTSDLVSNATRGVLAEFLVACALDLTHGIRIEWDAFDLQTQQGIKVEVKSAAYLQSWRQERHSKITFDIRPTLGWDAQSNTEGIDRKRQADIYIFALLKHLDKRTLDPLDVEQWEFYGLSSAVLDANVPNQKQIGLTALERLRPTKAKFAEIAAMVEHLSSATR